MTAHTNIRQSVDEHPFAQYVRILGKGKKGSRSFTQQEAFDAMSMILNGKVEDIQLGAFLMLIRVKEESPEELAGFVQAVNQSLAIPQTLKADLDWSSYAGKRRHLPWFIFSALLVAQAGYRVFMHGASGHTHNRIYTETIIERLGLSAAQSWQDCHQQLDKECFCFMPLSAISPKLAEMIDLRSMLGLRSPVHSLSRLINPLNADAVIQGVFHPPYLGLHQAAATLLNYKRTMVIKGEGGEIERNPDNDCTAFISDNGNSLEESWPALFDKRHTKPAELSFEDFIGVWNGSLSDEYGVAAIISTAALAFSAIDNSLTQEEAFQKANNAWKERDKNRFEGTGERSN